MENHGRLRGRTAIITGAASGIGKETALLFAREGARVMLVDIEPNGLKNVVALIHQERGFGVDRVADVSKEAEVQALIEATLQAFGQIDIVVNNAGVTGDLEAIDGQKGENWLRVYDINVLSAVYMTKHVVNHMKSRERGSIVNVASVAGIRSGAGSNAYSASKAALISFTQTSACDLGGYKVRVNAVCPGLIETGMTKAVFDYAKTENKLHKVGYRCELRRYGRAIEVAQPILFLASDESSYITGQALPVDGGNTASLNLPGMKF
jgi:meso-butanediol dehydrogenase / (S,S)-butanediol dehydrogenase / diacetyl reductase